MKAVQVYDQNQLFSIPVPVATRTYSPVSHKNVVERILEEADKANLVLKSTHYKGAREGNQVIGLFNFLGSNDNFGIQIGFRNSYDKSMSFGLVAGSQVFICENGCLSGEIQLKRVHKGTIAEEVDGKITTGFETIQEVYDNIITASEVLEEIPMNLPSVYELAGKLFLDQHILNSMQMNVLQEQLANSKNFRSMYEPGFSAWDAYNAVTEALKVSHPTSYLQDHIDFHQLMINTYIR